MRLFMDSSRHSIISDIIASSDENALKYLALSRYFILIAGYPAFISSIFIKSRPVLPFPSIKGWIFSNFRWNCATFFDQMSFLLKFIFFQESIYIRFNMQRITCLEICSRNMHFYTAELATVFWPMSQNQAVNLFDSERIQFGMFTNELLDIIVGLFYARWRRDAPSKAFDRL